VLLAWCDGYASDWLLLGGPGLGACDGMGLPRKVVWVRIDGVFLQQQQILFGFCVLSFLFAY
jgi:hypothetical protein